MRQSVNRRREGVKAGWGSEIAFRLGVVAGALAAIVLSQVAPAAIRVAAASWIGLVLLGRSRPSWL